jgi:adenosylcobinamide-GDP ribazoletransferase
MPLAGLRLAITMLTAVPLPAGKGVDVELPPKEGQQFHPDALPAAPAPNRRTAAAAMYWAPAVGLAIGAAAAGVLILASRYGHAGPLLAAVLAIGSLAALTRGLHLDGLADLADGLGSRKPAGQALEIMKRSDIGPFGVITLVLTLLVQVSALARAEQIGRGPAAVLSAAVAGRLAITLACRRGVQPARPGGLGALVAGTVSPVVAVLLCLAVLGGAAAFGWIYAVAIAAALAASLALTRQAERRLGGITGDVLGAVAEVSTAVCLLVTALR